jgi:hypothetical protein
MSGSRKGPRALKSPEVNRVVGPPPEELIDVGCHDIPDWTAPMSDSISTGKVSAVGTALVTGRDSFSPRLPTGAPSQDPSLQHKYRDLIQRHLKKFLEALYAEFTGLHFHIAWTPALPRRWDAQTLPTGRCVCCRLAGSSRIPDCRTCGQRRLARILGAGGAGRHFTCRRGVRNYWIPLRVRGQMLGLAYLQALEDSAAWARAGKRFSRAACTRFRNAGARVLSQRRFARAARLLREIVEHAQAASLTDLLAEDLTQTQRALQVFASVQARLQKELNGVVPTLHQTPPVPRPADQADRIVSAARDLIHQEQGRPTTLLECAARLGLNPSPSLRVISSVLRS